MAPSILGKHQRTIDDSHDNLQRSSSKRRAAQNPSIHHDKDDSLDLSPGPRKSKRLRAPEAENEPRTKRVKPCQSDETSSTLILTQRTKELVADENIDPNIHEFRTPRTKRFRDAVSNTSPVTPRHRVQVAVKPATPKTPRVISSTSSRSVYTNARQLFVRSANAGRLVGRQAEKEELAHFIEDAITSKRGGCMYVSGPPGTGKSALVEEVCRESQIVNSAKVTYINCASMTSARDIYGKLVEELCDDSQVFKKSELDRLRALFFPKRKSCADVYVVALDEIDHLLTSDLEILYSFFEWSMQTNSRLVLIGIANALDLTDRFLPRLKAKNIKPHLLPFLPYTSAQIASIIIARLRSLLPENATVAKDFVPFLHPAAIQLCARKVASQSGDLRKAFDLVRRTIECIEREAKQRSNGPSAPTKTPLLENSNLATPLSPPDSPEGKDLFSSYTPVTTPRATVAHVARVTSAAFGNGTAERLQGLNLHQKAALCALISIGQKQRVMNTPTKSPRSVAPNAKELFDIYSSLCRRDNVLQPLTPTEFKDILSSLETMGLIGENKTRGGMNGPAGLRTPSRKGRGSPSRTGSDGYSIICYVGKEEIKAQVTGPGEGVLQALLRD